MGKQQCLSLASCCTEARIAWRNFHCHISLCRNDLYEYEQMRHDSRRIAFGAGTAHWGALCSSWQWQWHLPTDISEAWPVDAI